MKKVLAQIGMTLGTLFLLTCFLTPFAYGVATSLKSPQQISEQGAPWWPASKAMYTYNDKDYDIYRVPMDVGTRELALFKPGRESSVFVDPANPEVG